MKNVWIVVLMFLGMTVLHAQNTDPAYQKELKRLYKGTVPLVTPSQLSQLVVSTPAPVILDTRSAKEYQVSHLQGAIFVDYDNFKENSIAHVDRSTPIVVYCSVGYRSERIGERLQKMGFTQVANLYGGIFEWVNQGHQVLGSDGKPTTKVHTYNADWGNWLRVGEKVVN